ncbi:MAG: DUF1820 family protein [Gammaproteobacteria bacterium]|nr:DUF1820 family protein [Gammaproteobacteria bacterium]
MTDEHLYRVRFFSQDKIYEVYARDVFQGEMYGFVVLEDLVFDNNSTVVVDPSEEKLKTEFEGVKQTIIPMHSVIRIDEVEKRGQAKIREIEGNVAHFPSPVYTPGRSES